MIEEKTKINLKMKVVLMTVEKIESIRTCCSTVLTARTPPKAAD
jgi:hypothetical protein